MNDKIDDIYTGDVVLMSSITPFAVVVKWCVASEYNHIAIAVRIDETMLPEIKVMQKGGRLCLIEFNGDNFKNVLTGEIHHGNRLVEFTDLLPKYKKIAVRRLNPIYITDDFYRKTEHFIMENCLTLCKMDICSPILCVLGINQGIDREMPQFCSELVSKYYQTTIPGSIECSIDWLPPHYDITNKDLEKLFIGDELVVIETPHVYMDFFWSPWILVLVVVIIIIIFYFFRIRKN